MQSNPEFTNFIPHALDYRLLCFCVFVMAGNGIYLLQQLLASQSASYILLI